MAKNIPLTQGQYAIVDDADFDWLNQWRWHFNRTTGYASRRDRKGMRTILMHRLIIGAPTGSQTDHVDGDGLNNQRHNLRICTASQNQQNRKPQAGSRSQYKGVSFYDDVYVVRIYVNEENLYLGRFTDERLAAQVYDFAATKYYGEFAALNFPDEPLLPEATYYRVALKKPTISKYRGVSWAKDKQRWIAYIQSNYKFIHLGYFDDEISAARTYNLAAVKYHGSKAKPNHLPQERETP